jgi:hypothetical protein
MRVSALIALVAIHAGCGSGDEPAHEVPPPGEPAECVAGELDVDGRCIAAGLPADAPCMPAEVPDDSGSCIPAGVAPARCAQGFTPDGEAGCEAVLPASPCEPGQMAIPGETACRDIAPCGSGTWGDIPVDDATEYVDVSYTGGSSQGTALEPWITIGDAVAAAAPGALIAVAAGTYQEDVLIFEKAARLWGRCPQLVEVASLGEQSAAVGVVLADGAEVRGIAIRGPGLGLGVSGAQDLVVDSVWIHDAGARAIEISTSAGPASVHFENVLLEDNVEIGIFLSGSQATVAKSVIRDTMFDASGNTGRGISIQDSAEHGPATLAVSDSVIERNRDAGLFVAGSNATVERTVIRGTEPDSDGGGRGILAQPGATPSTLDVVGSLIDQNTEAGVYVSGTNAQLDATVVRGTRATEAGEYGRGIEASPSDGAPTELVVRGSLVRDNAEIGVLVGGASQATVEGTVIRDTRPAADGNRGIGIKLQSDAGGRPTLSLRSSLLLHNREYGIDVDSATATIESSIVGETFRTEAGELGLGILVRTGSDAVVRGSVVENVHDLGVLVEGSSATVESSVVRDVRANDTDVLGRGIQVQYDGLVAGSLALRSSRIERTREAALVVVDSDATVEACVISETHAHAQDGLHGDGIVVHSNGRDATASVVDTRIEHSARAAISSFGSAVNVASSDFVCQLFDLDGEGWATRPFTWKDDGNNRCGCPEPDRDCVAVSSQIAPPSPIPPSPSAP